MNTRMAEDRLLSGDLFRSISAMRPAMEIFLAWAICRKPSQNSSSKLTLVLLPPTLMDRLPTRLMSASCRRSRSFQTSKESRARKSTPSHAPLFDRLRRNGIPPGQSGRHRAFHQAFRFGIARVRLFGDDIGEKLCPFRVAR